MSEETALCRKEQLVSELQILPTVLSASWFYHIQSSIFIVCLFFVCSVVSHGEGVCSHAHCCS